MLIGDIVQYCSDPALGSFLSIIKRIFLMMEIITPILLIVGIGIPVLKLITNDPDDAKLKKNVMNAVTAAVVVMLLPAIVNLVMFALNSVTNSRFVVSECWNDAKVYTGSAQYITKKTTGKEHYNALINPDDYKGVDYDPNYRADRQPVDDDDDEYDYSESLSFGDIVWDPNDVTKISNLNTAQLIAILNKHSTSAKNFVPYAQDLIAAEHKYHVNVFFLTAIDALESGWVTSSIAKACNNLGGVTESSAHPSNGCGSNSRHKFAYFSSVGEYIKYHGKLLHNNYLTKGGSYYHGKSVKGVNTSYCPPNVDPGCDEWGPSVTKIANSLFKQVKKLNLASSGVAEKIARAAEYYAWPAGTPDSKTKRQKGGGNKPEFMRDYRNWWPKYKNNSDPSQKAGTCCCHWARTCVVKALGRKPFTFTLLPNSGKDEYTRKEMAKLGFSRIAFDGKKSSLRRGDVLYYRNKGSGGHVWIYLGNSKAAEASHSGYAGRITTVNSYKLKTSNKSVYYIFRHTG